MEAIKSASFDSKQKFVLPAGAVILKKDFSIRVEEIENGFIITKNYDIKYQSPDSESSNYEYFTKKWFSKTNPLKVESKDKQNFLSDKID